MTVAFRPRQKRLEEKHLILYSRQILLLPMSSHYHTFLLFCFTCKKMKKITEGNEFIGRRKQMFKKEIAIYQTAKQFTLIIAFFFLAITCTIFYVTKKIKPSSTQLVD